MTSVNNNPFDGKHVCFEINSIAGAEVKKHLNIDEFPPDAIVNKHGKKLLYGVVCKPVPKSTNLYNVVWNYTGLQPMNMAGDWICTGMLLHKTIKIMDSHQTAKIKAGKSNEDKDGDADADEEDGGNEDGDVDEDEDADVPPHTHMPPHQPELARPHQGQCTTLIHVLLARFLERSSPRLSEVVVVSGGGEWWW